MSNKFEQLLDLIVNEEHAQANELFHAIVVEKSREIYNNLIAEEEETEEETTEAMDCEEEEEKTEESFAAEEEEEEETKESIYSEEEEEGEFPVQDPTDDLESDVVDHDFGGEDDGEEGEGEPATKGDIDDLADALDELKMEFEKLMAGEEAEEHEHPGIHSEPGLTGGDDAEGEFGDEEEEESYGMESIASEEEEEEEGPKSAGEKMREYIERVSVKMVDGEGVGSGRGDKAGQTGGSQGKSPISSGSGKPTSGANAKNIAQAGKGTDEDGTSPKGKVGGLVKKGGDFVPAGTKNVSSSASSKKPDGAKLSNVSKPASKEGAGVGAQTGGDKAGQTGGATNTKSIVDKKL